MSKCEDCPLLGEQTVCMSHDRRWAMFCEWAASGDPVKRQHIVYRSRIGARPEPVYVRPDPAPQPPRPVIREDARRDGDDATAKVAGQDADAMRRVEEQDLQEVVAVVEQCIYRGERADCACNGRRKCLNGKGVRGEVTLNDCIACVQAGGP